MDVFKKNLIIITDDRIIFTRKNEENLHLEKCKN